jgi:hypothetical protein
VVRLGGGAGVDLGIGSTIRCENSHLGGDCWVVKSHIDYEWEECWILLWSLSIWHVVSPVPPNSPTSICSSHAKSTFHLFFECPYAFQIWCWFTTILNITLSFTSLEDIWNLCDRNWYPQCKVIIKATLMNIINVIWQVKNQARLQNKSITWKLAISLMQLP